MKLLKGGELLTSVKEMIRKGLLGMHPLKRPGFAIVINEDDYGSLQYANQLIKDCNDVGINVFSVRVNKSADEMFIYRAIDDFNTMEDVTAIMVQHPLPEQFREMEKDIINMIDAKKIVDAPFWRMDLDIQHTWPGTPYGIYLMLKSHLNGEFNGKKIVVIGRSKTVGMPLSMILTYYGATVTTCHSKTGIDNIREYCKNADIIISAAGCPNLIDDSFELNEHQTIIDVGCNMLNGKLCGDVSFNQVAEKVGAITPVPGGVGPMTRLAILTEIIEKSE